MCCSLDVSCLLVCVVYCLLWCCCLLLRSFGLWSFAVACRWLLSFGVGCLFFCLALFVARCWLVVYCVVVSSLFVLCICCCCVLSFVVVVMCCWFGICRCSCGCTRVLCVLVSVACLLLRL